MHRLNDLAFQQDCRGARPLPVLDPRCADPMQGIALGAVLGAVINIILLATATYFI